MSTLRMVSWAGGFSGWAALPGSRENSSKLKSNPTEFLLWVRVASSRHSLGAGSELCCCCPRWQCWCHGPWAPHSGCSSVAPWLPCTCSSCSTCILPTTRWWRVSDRRAWLRGGGRTAASARALPTLAHFPSSSFQGSWTRWRAPTSRPYRGSPETSLPHYLLPGFPPPCSTPQPGLSP